MTITPEWQQLAVYAVIAALVLLILQRIPYIGRVVSAAVSLALLALCIFIVIQQAPYQPALAGFAERLGLDRQEVVGDEVRIRMSPDGHFWANVSLNGVERRMLIDSGATITAISEATATEARIGGNADLVPIVLMTANGNVPARTGTIDRMSVGSITARNLKVAISPALGDVNMLGMNFLSQLASWRVEGRTLIMVPKTAKGGAETRPD